MMARRVPASLLSALLLTACAPASGDAGGRAGLVIVHGDQTVVASCVAFPGTETTGERLLALSGLENALDAANPMGSLVCSIDGEGCAFPSEDCLCACRGPGGCSYWAYFNLRADGEWGYAVQGAAMRTVQDGDVDAWIWLDRSLPGDALPLPPNLTFSSLCP